MRSDTSGFETPVLFIIFNRPQATLRVFERVRELKPKYLFIAADGPRTTREQEAELCSETRKVVSKIDWPCTVKTKFEKENLGCRVAVSSAISWFFNQVESGIILEDDCLPESDFFYFCSQLLSRYSDENRVMHIGGANFQRGQQRGDADYYFSIYSHIWGWATWRRAWQLYDVNMNQYGTTDTFNMLRGLNPNKHFINFWNEVFRETYLKKIDTWDHQWTYTVWRNKGLAIVPQKNLVTNIGFGYDATHTHTENWMANLETSTLALATHPEKIALDDTADKFTTREVYGISTGGIRFLKRWTKSKMLFFARSLGLLKAQR